MVTTLVSGGCSDAATDFPPHGRARPRAERWRLGPQQPGLTLFLLPFLVAPVSFPQQEQPSVRLLKHIIRCYLRLSDNAKCVLELLCEPH